MDNLGNELGIRDCAPNKLDSKLHFLADFKDFLMVPTVRLGKFE